MQDAHAQSARRSLMEEIEHTLTTGSREQRADTLRRITDLFIVSASDLNEQVTQIFDDVMGMLVEAIETKVRAELSKQLAPIANAPINVIQRLAPAKRCLDEDAEIVRRTALAYVFGQTSRAQRLFKFSLVFYHTRLARIRWLKFFHKAVFSFQFLVFRKKSEKLLLKTEN